MRKRLLQLCLVGLTVVALLPAARPAAASGWEWEIGVYLWALGMDGRMTVRGQTGELETSFSDIVSVLDMAASLHVEAKKADGQLGWFFDFFGANLGESFDRPRGEFDMKMAYVEGAVTHDMDENFQLFAGLRYITMDLDLIFDPRGPGLILPDQLRVEGDQSWTDLMLGGRVGKEFGDNWAAWVRIDMAGFGISNSSEFTLNALVMGRRNFTRSKKWAFVFGYRVFQIDYEDLDAGFAMDVTQFGPVLAFGYRF